MSTIATRSCSHTKSVLKEASAEFFAAVHHCQSALLFERRDKPTQRRHGAKTQVHDSLEFAQLFATLRRSVIALFECFLSCMDEESNGIVAMNDSADTRASQTNSGMPEFYFRIRFRIESAVASWPREFAIITAWATTGQSWSLQRNVSADEVLRIELVRSAFWHHRITGYGPDTGHSEPGWAVETDFITACAIGRRFLQHAIYFVSNDTLSVAPCDPSAMPTTIGSFRDRLDDITPGPLV
jgi:hypothetical protein